MEAMWIVSAFAVGWLASRAGLPPLVGYLLAGVGLSLAGMEPGPVTDELAEVGILLLLFTVGLKLRWQSLVAKEVLGIGVLHLAILAGLFGAIFLWRGIPNQTAWLVAGGLAFSSTVLAAKLFEARSELGTFHGRLTIGLLVIQDLAAMAILASMGAKAPSPWAVVLLLAFFARPVLGWIVDRSGHSELLLLLGVGLAVGMAGAAKSLGISPELGALLAGAVLAGHPHATEMSKTLWGIKEFFLVAFFLKMGLFGLPVGWEWAWAGVILALIPLKFGVIFGSCLLFRLRARTAYVTAVGLATYSEFALITCSAAVSAGLVNSSWLAITAMSVMASLAVSAPLNKHVHSLFDRLEPWLEKFEWSGEHRDDEPTKLGRAAWTIVGMGRTGAAAYRALEAQGHRVVGLDADMAKVQSQLAKGRRVVYGDAEDRDLWGHLEMKSLSGILLTLPDYESKHRAVTLLRREGFKGLIGATTHHLEEDEPMLKAGCDFIFHPFAAAGEKLAERAIAGLTEEARKGVD